MGRTLQKKKQKSELDGETDENKPAAARAMLSAANKREYDDDDNCSDQEDCEDDSPDFSIGNEMSSLLKNFQNDVKKNMSAKRKRLETLTSQSATNCKSKRKERLALRNEYNKQMNIVLGQLENDVAKVKENEEKLTAQLQEQMKQISQIRVVQTHRHRSLKQLQEQYFKTVEETEANHVQQKAKVTNDLKSELARLQSKILKDTQTQEMAVMKQNFHSMLFK